MMKRKSLFAIILFCIILIIPVNSWCSEKWNYDDKNNTVYSIYQTIDDKLWSVYLILQVTKNRIIFKATIPFSEYSKYFTFQRPTILHYNDIKLVRHETFFWGKDNEPVVVEIDQEKLTGFSRINGYEIIYTGDSTDKIINKLKKGNTLKINKHYWSQKSKKSIRNFLWLAFLKHIQK